MRIIASLLILTLAAADARSESFTIKDIMGGLKARSKSLRNCTITMKIRTTLRSQLTGDIHELAIINEIRLDRVLKRFRYHSFGQSLMPPAAYKANKEYLLETDETNVFDGERTRNYTRFPGMDREGESTRRYIETCRIDGKRKPVWIISPEDLINSHGGSDLLPYLEAGNWSIVGRDGELLAAECTPTHNASAKADYRGKVWFAPDKGMMPVRKQSLFLRSGDKDWVTYYEGFVEESSEVEPGLWMPRRYWDNSLRGQPGESMTSLRRNEASIDYSEINEEFPPEAFTLAFPPNLVVTDAERGTTYKTAAITDKMLDEDAGKSLELRSVYEKERSSTEADKAGLRKRWSRIISITIAAVLAAAALGYFVVRKTLKRRQMKG